MTMRTAHTNPDLLARALFRLVTRRLARGYMPSIMATERDGQPVVLLALTIDKAPRPSDRTYYSFRFPAATRDVAGHAVQAFKKLCRQQ